MSSIAIVLPGYARGAVGGYKVVYEYANYLVDHGHSVSLIQMLPAHEAPRLSGWRRVRRAIRSRLNRAKRPQWFTLDDRVSVANYDRPVHGAIPRCDVLMATAVETAQLVADVAQERGLTGMHFVQHYEDWVLGSDFVDGTWRLPLHKIVIAPWLKQKADDLDVESVLVPNGIDASSFPVGPPISDRPMQVMALVSPASWKRTDLIAQVMAIIARTMPEVHLRTFGVAEKPALLPDSVEHIQLPNPAQLRELYQQSRIHICASDNEGWHLPPAEAMSSGAAVVSTDINGVRAYADGVALFSPVGDADRLAENVLRLLKDETLCSTVAASGNERIRLYSPERAAESFEREIARALRGHREAAAMTNEAAR